MTEAKEVSIKAASVSDQATEKDSLGFEPYTIAIADFLTELDTQAPLTLSVEGVWGIGKSSFMKQLQKKLETRSVEKAHERLKNQHQKCIENVQKYGDRLWEDLWRLRRNAISNKQN